MDWKRLVARLMLCLLMGGSSSVFAQSSGQDLSREPWILLYAFEPFGGRDQNQSLEIIHALQARHSESLVETCALPVRWSFHFEVFLACYQEHVDRHEGLAPRAILGFGEWNGLSGAQWLPLERARNSRSVDLMDSDGDRAPTPRISDFGNRFYELPLSRLVFRQMWRRRTAEYSLASPVSNARHMRLTHSYICNDSAYQIALWWQNEIVASAAQGRARRSHSARASMGFFHVPLSQDTSEDELSLLIRTFDEFIIVLLEAP